MRCLLPPGWLDQLEPAARAAAEDLDGYARREGLPELELVEPPADLARWVEAGCAWAARRGLYSRRQRAVVLARLRKGRPSPSWDIREGGDLIVCIHRNFSWRSRALAIPEAGAAP